MLQVYCTKLLIGVLLVDFLWYYKEIDEMKQRTMKTNPHNSR